MATQDKRIQLEVDLNDVYIHTELNNRMLADSEDKVKELAASIGETNGLLQPIGICKRPKEQDSEHDKPYILVYGFRRCAALHQLAEMFDDENWTKHVPAMVSENVSSSQRHIDQLTENLHRKDLHPIEIANAFMKALDDPGNVDFKQADLSRRINWTPGQVSKYVKVARTIHPDVQQWCIEGKLSYSHVQKISEFDLPHDQQLSNATIGIGKSYGDFEAYMDGTYGRSDPAKDEATTDTTQPTPPQRLKQAKSARQLEDKYVPYLVEKVEKLTGKERSLWEARLDAMRFVLNIDGTKLGTELAPWEQELEAKAAAEKAGKEDERLRKKAISVYCKLIDEVLAYDPPLEADVRVKNTLSQAYEKVKKEIIADLAEAKAVGLEEGRSMEGYLLGKSVDDFVNEISIAWRDGQKEKEERKKKADEKRAVKKLVDDAAAAEAKEQADPELPADQQGEDAVAGITAGAI